MSSIVDMIRRISLELGENNLEEQIENAIRSAIGAYQTTRFYFNETRDIVIQTVPRQAFYSETDNPLIGKMIDIDYVILILSGVPYKLVPKSPYDLEYYTTNASAGDPYCYTFYDEKIRIYPVPEAQLEIRIGASIVIDAPVENTELNNVWMTKAERLIRSRAKWELALHTLDTTDVDLATKMAEATQEALDQLERRTTSITKIGDGRIRPFSYP